MGEMWQGFFALVALAALSGLSFIAYHHPSGYRRVYLPLVCAVWGVWLAWIIYSFGYERGFSTAVLATMKLNSPQLVKTPSSGPAMWWVFFVPAALYGYLSFLLYLPSILGSERPSTSRDNDQQGGVEQ